VGKVIQNLKDQLLFCLNYSRNKKLRVETVQNYSLKGFDDLNCIFVHIPKTAGISVNLALFGNYGGGHKTVRHYKRIFGPVTYHRYYSFTFVRNPLTRLHSAYLFLRQGGINNRDHAWSKKYLKVVNSFEDFVLNYLGEDEIINHIHFLPQHYFVCDGSMNPEVNFIGRYENLDDDFGKICRTLGVEKKLMLTNQSAREKLSMDEIYTDSMKKTVFELYKDDFTIFQYKLNTKFMEIY